MQDQGFNLMLLLSLVVAGNLEYAGDEIAFGVSLGYEEDGFAKENGGEGGAGEGRAEEIMREEGGRRVGGILL